LNSLPVGEGATDFPCLGIQVTPVARKAVFFCNVTEKGLGDPRLVHSAQPVNPPHHKFGLNIWITDTTNLGYLQEKEGVRLKNKK